MRKIYLIGAGIAILVGGLYIYFKQQADILKNFTWRIKQFKVKSFSLNNLALEVSFLFTSKADVEATIKKMYFDLYLQDKNVGFIRDEKEFIIPANGSSEVPLFISINPQEVLKNIIGISVSGARSKDLKFKLEGYVNIKSGFISTTIPVVYETTIKEYLGLLPIK